MKKYDLVSIIIPCYNQAEYLEESVQSAVDQTYPNIEIIIVNDGSSDNTEKVAVKLQNTYPEKIHILTQNNSGLSEARNNGVQKALGEYIVPLDADDLIHKDMVLKCVETLEKHNVDIVYTDTKGFGIQDFVLRWKPFSETNPLYVTTSNATALYKKKVWQEIGGYKINMKGGYEDWEFWINAYKHDFLFQHHSEVLFYYRNKKESMYIQTLQQKSYHRAKILLNHPEMYIYESIQKAISTVIKTEKSARYYFYCNQQKISDEEKLLSEAVDHIKKNTLKTEQIVNIANRIILLCEVTVLSDSNYVKNIQSTMKIDIVLCYSSLRYNIPSFYYCKYAWYHTQGLQLVEGSIFPFFIRFSEDQYELTAYKELTKYLEQKSKTFDEKVKAITWRDEALKKKDESLQIKQDEILHIKTQLEYKIEVIEEKMKAIAWRDEALKKKDESLQIKRDEVLQIKAQLTSLYKNNIFLSPSKKLRAYMNLKKIYANYSRKTKQFDIAISIGHGCNSRYNISRILWLRKYGQKNLDKFVLSEQKKNTDDWGSFFFDWSVSPLSGVNLTLKNKFENNLKLENIEIKTIIAKKQIIFDNYSNFKYPHSIEGTNEGLLTNKMLLEAYPQFKSKMDYLAEKTKEILISRKKILFVRSSYASIKDLKEFKSIIETIYDVSEYTILYTPDYGTEEELTRLMGKQYDYEELGKVIFRPILNTPYPGDFKGWEKALSDIEITLPAHKDKNEL